MSVVVWAARGDSPHKVGCLGGGILVANGIRRAVDTLNLIWQAE